MKYKRILMLLSASTLFIISSFFILAQNEKVLRENESPHAYEGFYDLLGAKMYNNMSAQAGDYNQVFKDNIPADASVFVLPHDAAVVGKLDAFYAELSKNDQDDPDTIIILGPDHHWVAEHVLTTTKNSWHTPFGKVEPDMEFVDHIIRSADVKEQKDIFREEHSIALHVPLIAKHFPKSRIVPVIVSPKNSNSSLAMLAEEIYAYKNQHKRNIHIVASVDFYHGGNPRKAYLDDIEAWRILASDDINQVNLVNADSTASLYAVKYYSELIGAPNFKRLARTSTEEPVSLLFTTHLYGAFTGIVLQPSQEPPAKLVFVGDVMLDRYVETVFNRVGGEEMFHAVRKLSEGNDLFIFNHEGTFPDVNIPQDMRSLSFSFREEPLRSLREAGADIAGLANNHTFDFGNEVYLQTRNNLHRTGFEVFGAPRNASFEDIVLNKKVSGKNIAFYGYHQFGNNPERIIEAIRENSAQDQVNIVFAHWGREYTQHPSDAKRNLAQKFHEAGADIIIGHHPHIVQPFEKTAENITFYSLGNFIFDQYFLEPTQYGLALQVIIEADKIVSMPIPVSLKGSVPKIEPLHVLDDENLYPGFSGVRLLEITI